MGVHTYIAKFTATLDPSSVSANSTAEQTFTVSGVSSTDDVLIAAIKPSNTSGVTIGNARISADDTVAIQFVNPTASDGDPGSEDYTFVIARNFQN